MEQFTKNEDLLLSVLEFLDRNGFKQSFEKLQQKTGVYYNDIKIIKDLLHSRKFDELIIFIRNNSKIKNEEKMAFIKLLKIKKYIYLIVRNCYDRIDQKDSLYYLRTEIAPMINNTIDKNKNLLSSLTNILFYKDMNLLTDYIKKNLKIYSDDSYIISKLSQNRIIPIEKLYDIYHISENKKEISFEKYDVITIKDLCFNSFKTSEIWFLEISKNKKYVALGFSNCNISLISVICKNNKINLNLYLTFSSNENSKKGEITSLNFSNDEKYLLVSLTNSIKIFNVLNGEKIKEYNNLHNTIITSCLYISNSNSKFISGSIDKKLLLVDTNTNAPFLEIGKFFRIKQLLYSEFNNLIIIIPGSLNDIICYDLSKNKTSYKIEIKEQIVYTNISKNDKGKYILINKSKSNPKISLYNLENRKIEGNFDGHTQRTMIIKCSFAGDKDQYIISGSEDSNAYLWDRNIPGKPKYIFKDHLGIVNSVELLFNDVLLSVSDDKSLKIWIPKNDENDNTKEILFNKNEKNILKIVEDNFEKEFFEKMNEPLEEVQAEEENVEESDEEEERIGELRYEGID